LIIIIKLIGCKESIILIMLIPIPILSIEYILSINALLL
jgi:hypothetical protein